MSDPRESALIVPVPEAEPLVGAWRERYDDSARTGVPAHLTLLYPFLDPHEIRPADLDQLAQLFASTPATPFRLVAVRRFSRGVLYLAPEPGTPFRSLTRQLWLMYPDHPPYGGAFNDVIPHLTVAQSPDHVLLNTVEAAVAPGLPIDAYAGEAWLMLQDETGRWRPGHRFPMNRVDRPDWPG
ncbi:MAG TPA: 2'-5' RNA ligase family protein [Candidatus Dormibacteraeota bacterium]|nr:2'-5' RNA ligase family protein [Candidatus Dormibacteraeota bacterium]